MAVTYFLGSMLVTLLVLYQGIHFYEAHDACVRTHMENSYLLKNPLCADPWERRLHGPKQDQVCQRAAVENGVHPLACAWKHTWEQVGVNRLWATVTESYWLLFGIITPTCCTAIIMLFWTWNQRSARKATQEMIGAIQRLQAPVGSERKKEKRKKVYQLVAEPSYFERQRETQGTSPRVELLNV
jgi:hypothetical protein